MEEIPSGIKHLIERIWEEPLHTRLLSEKIDLAGYKGLGDIPDRYIPIEEVFPENELNAIWNRFKPYLHTYKVFPFLGTLGEAVIGIGYGRQNSGRLYYFDFDFGCFPLDDNLDHFIAGLIES
ncbi:SMI1/KNR4 family protein [Sinomicrobium pectinilyticum]|uniref:SMI1/KNR4 family protein n=1 Tax=Sinomicrobium pectinilyticum TaxID=1084421 RepID=A0A3N0DQU6_SINP1|nr:SMI1/KNR4 family protein [Sinomicrobium pectinilyticum]RNL78002.1 SMI1/KNR4 family protein [Sinomicrobium pectinilyticum]